MKTRWEDCDVRERCEIELVPVNQFVNAKTLLSGCCLHPFPWVRWGTFQRASSRFDATWGKETGKSLQTGRSNRMTFSTEISCWECKSLESLGKTASCQPQASCNMMSPGQGFPGKWTRLDLCPCAQEGYTMMCPSHTSSIIDTTYQLSLLRLWVRWTGATIQDIASSTVRCTRHFFRRDRRNQPSRDKRRSWWLKALKMGCGGNPVEFY